MVEAISRTARRVVCRDGLTIAALSLLVILLRFPALEQPFDNDSAAIAYHARLIARGEPLYGTHHPAHHLPATYYTYALAFRLFGDSVWAVKFLLIPWTIATVYLLYRLGVLFADRETGVLAAVFYALLSSHVFLFGSTAEIEMFANLPRIAAIILLVHLAHRQAAPWKFLCVGMTNACAFLFKANYLSTLVMAGVVLLVEMWRTRREAGALRKMVMRGVWTAVGFTTVVLLVAAYFGSMGLWHRFWQVFTIGQNYVRLRNSSAPDLASGFIYPFVGLVVNNAALVILACCAVLVFFRYGIWRRDGHERRTSAELYLVIWYFLSHIEAGTTHVYFPHYYQLVIPPLVLLAAKFLLEVYRQVKTRASRRWAGTLALILALVISIGISVRHNWTYYYVYARYKLGIGTYEDFLTYGWFSPEDQEFVRVQELADYVRSRTGPSDYIYCWSGSIQVYYLADRLCPVDTIWPIQAEVTGSHERIFVDRTKYLIISDTYSVPRPEWLNAKLSEQYSLETVIRGEKVYRRQD